MKVKPLPAATGARSVVHADTAGTMPWRRWLPIAAVLGAACCWGTQGIAYALILDGVQTDGLTVVTLRAATATALLWIWLAVTDPAALRIPRTDLPVFTVLGLIAVTIFYPSLFYAYGLSQLPASEASILLTFEPVVALILAAGVLGESLALGQWLGASSVLAGVLLLTWPHRPVKKRIAWAQLSTGVTAHDAPPTG